MAWAEMIKAPRAVQQKIADAMFNYSLIALACHRGGPEALERYGEALEEAALELEGALAEGARWIGPLVGKPSAKRPPKGRSR